MHLTVILQKNINSVTKFHDTGAIPSVYGSPTTFTATNRTHYFQRSGKKSRIEHFRRQLFNRRSVSASSEPILDRASQTTSVPSFSRAASTATSQALLRNFFLAATPFVALKTRRRGKRVAVKLTYLERTRGERKALQALSANLHRGSKQSSVKVSTITSKEWTPRSFQTSASNTEVASINKLHTYVIRAHKGIIRGSSFAQRLERELSVDSPASTNEKVGSSGGLREKRDELHRTAFQSLPYGWARKLFFFLSSSVG